MKRLLSTAFIFGLIGSVPCFADSASEVSATEVTRRALSQEDLEREQELDPYAQIPAVKPERSAIPAKSSKAEAKGLIKDLKNLGADVGKAGINTIEGTKHLVGGADDLVKATDAVVRGAEATPGKVVDGVEAAPKAVIKGTKNLINDVAFPADANTMDYDGDI